MLKFALVLLGLTAVHSISYSALPSLAEGEKLTIAFAANSQYFLKNLAIVEVVGHFVPREKVRLIVYDIGFDEKQHEVYECATPAIADEVRSFPFEKFRPHVKNLHTYAFKPLLIHELYHEFNSSVIWLDSGLTFGGHEHFFNDALEAATKQGGVHSDITARSLTDFTHDGMFSYFEKHWGWSKDRFLSLDPPVSNCNGAFSTWIYSPEPDHVGRTTLELWYECGNDVNCIAPPGSGRGNHRQDQAALTLLLAMQGLRCTDGWVHPHGMRPHGTHEFLTKYAPQCAHLFPEE